MFSPEDTVFSITYRDIYSWFTEEFIFICCKGSYIIIEKKYILIVCLHKGIVVNLTLALKTLKLD